MASGGGQDGELGVALVRYKSGDSDLIGRQYAEDAKYALVFWILAVDLFFGVLATVDLIFLWIVVPLTTVVVLLILRAIRIHDRRRRMMNLEIKRQQEEKQKVGTEK